MKVKYAVVGSDLDLLDDLIKSQHQVSGYFSTYDKNNGFRFLGDHNKIKEYISVCKVIVAVDNINFRKNLNRQFGELISGFISPSANISNLTKIPSNLLAYPNTYIGPRVDIGELVKISVGAQIHHESKIGDFTVIGPRTLVLGRVEIGQECFVGSGTILSPSCKIGSNVILGMGSNVTRNLSDNLTAWGNPARIVNTGK